MVDKFRNENREKMLEWGPLNPPKGDFDCVLFRMFYVTPWEQEIFLLNNRNYFML
jgi:hypothetical protein